MTNEAAIEQDLIRDATIVDLHTNEPVITPCPTPGDAYIGDMVHVRIEGRIGDPEDEDAQDDVEFSAFGLIFTLGALSFDDAKPRGVSINDYREKDAWTAADMLRHLRFERGELSFYADYVRGRMMKTKVVVRKDGTFVLETQNRGEVASRWITKLQGKEGFTASPGLPSYELN